MKSMMKAIFVAAIFLVCTVPAANAVAPVSVAVIDVQKLLTESKAGKNIHQQLEAHKSKFLSDLSQKEQKLRDEEKLLTEQRGSLSAEEFANKARQFEEKLTETRRDAQEHKKILEEAAVKSASKLRDEVLKIVQALSDENGYDLVINRQNVVLSNKAMDITDETLARLDKKISQIPLEIADQ